jgi:transposase-like protein
MKTEKYISDFNSMLKKVTIEATLGTELDNHFEYDRNQPATGGKS